MKPTIQYPDFAKVDIQVGTVMAASCPDWSEKLIEFTVYFGPEIGERTIFSGLRQWYAPEHFMGKNFLFVVNLAERKMGPATSQGMLLVLDEPGHPRIFEVEDLAKPGTPVA